MARREASVEPDDGASHEAVVSGALKPKLNAETLYLGDNGRCFCGSKRCAGSTAHFTGYDLSGQKAEPIDAATAAQYSLRCETCGRAS
jgi:hypothetical protein